jgi:hypothetical protein
MQIISTWNLLEHVKNAPASPLIACHLIYHSKPKDYIGSIKVFLKNSNNITSIATCFNIKTNQYLHNHRFSHKNRSRPPCLATNHNQKKIPTKQKHQTRNFIKIN